MLKVIFFLSKTDQGKVVLIVIERQQTIYAWNVVCGLRDIQLNHTVFKIHYVGIPLIR